jgi:MSHA biogenesis protein MshQ
MNGLATPSTTVNYDGSVNTTPNFAKTVTFSEVNGVAGTISSATVPASAFTAGIATVTPAFTFSTTPTAPAVIRIRATDTSGISSVTGTEGTTLIRSGRIKLSNAYGSELLDLAMPLTAQYWNGNAWITNSNDLCTTGVSLSLTDVNATDGLTTSELCAWEAGSLGNSGLGCSVAGTVAKQFSEPPIAGDFNLNFKATGTGNTGALNVIATVPSYLQYYWTYDPTKQPPPICNVTNPKVRATFGIYKGKDKQIYFRELY